MGFLWAFHFFIFYVLRSLIIIIIIIMYSDGVNLLRLSYT